MDSALEYVQMGWAVFPLNPKDKTPISGSKGFKDATKSPRTIKQWWNKADDMNIGIATGAASGIFVIDIDQHGDIDGAESLFEWESGNGKLNETVCSTTGSGGTHYFYRCPAGVSITSAAHVIDGVDVRGDGGYIVAPPSTHPNGNRYEWDLSPEDIEIAEPNEAVMKLISLNGSQEHKEFVLPETIGKGERDNTLYKYACSLQARGLPDDFIFNAVADANNSRCNPSLAAKDIKRIVNSALGYDKGDTKEKEKKSHPRYISDKGKPIPSLFAAHMIDKMKCCKVDNVPAIWTKDHYSLGWHEIDKGIVKLCNSTRMADRREVRDYLNIIMPYRESSDPKYIAFSNGVLNVETGSFTESTPDLVITNIIPHKWNPNAKCDAIDELLHNVSCGHEPTYINLIEVAGMCMMRTNEFQECPILIGEGANGKSTFIKVLRRMLGNENVSSLDISMFAKQFYTGQLAGKLANLGDDISSEFLDGNDLAQFRKVVTGEWVYADVKGSQGFEFQPYCTVVLSANDFPKMKDATFGVSRRLFPIPFNACFVGDSKDSTISDRLKCEEASERLIQLAAIGIASVAANGGNFTRNELGEEARKEIERDSNNVLDWIYENDISGTTLIGSVTRTWYREYEKWANTYGMKPIKMPGFSKRVCRALEITTKQKKIEGVKERVFCEKYQMVPDE